VIGRCTRINRLNLCSVSCRSVKEKVVLSYTPAVSFCKRKATSIPATDRGGLYSGEMLRINHCLDNWLTDGC
jgi:hypothetical protein